MGMKLGWVLFGCVLFVGCGDDDGATDAGLDAGTTDGGGADASGSDASSEDASADDASTDADVDDADVTDAETSDAGDQDAATEDGGPPGCDYVAVNEVVVRCDGDFTFVGNFASTVEGCEPFWGFSPEGPRFDSAASTIGSDPSCDAGCIYSPRTAVTRTCSGVRTGYERFVAPDCPDVYRFPAGWYGSVEEHDAENPCE
jgi:hypothetical protein